MNTPFSLAAALVSILAFAPASRAQTPLLRGSVQSTLDKESASLLELYQYLHAHPELSLHEAQTAARVARELREAGYEVTPDFGGHGVVAVMRNGAGPTVLVRADMDALPVKEQTGLPFASTVTTKDDEGREVPVMHACGHDMHMTVLVGTARVLQALRDRWQGTLVLIGQPAEERVSGARRMLAEGLFTRFPRPDFCLAAHVSADLPAGSLGYTEGYALANTDSVGITLRGVGGHGAFPHKAKDPVVLAAQTVLALQTIVSREIPPGDAAVVTIGSIHGGTRANIIPDEVRLQLTLRSYTAEVRLQTIEAIRRITRGLAVAAGMPEDRMPVVQVGAQPTPATYNDPKLTQRLAGVWRAWFGDANVMRTKPVMGAEDFGEYGRTVEKIPICIFWIGALDPAAMKEKSGASVPLPSLHSPLFAPLPQPTLKAGVTAMTAAVLELVGRK